jgi:methylase of polypeptide subunit release factors
MFQETRGIRRAKISVAIQTALLDAGISFFDIQNNLQQNYEGATFNIIIENPEYLKKILRDSYRDKYEQVTESITKYLSEDANHISIEYFLESLNK